ncbi:MAG: glycosyltransferase family 39 protein, partial [Anaerolineales bacterium]|nr:glycosyltransferase family 39 protein [Anaerolineales bacterium]
LLAFGLRVYALTAVPPGLTHDEANHGREAIEILDGNLRFYFPLNYGSEPLYSYTVAGTMALVGENLFALRLAGVFFGLLALAALYRWAGQVFGREVGLLAVGLTAVSYWAIVTSRMALRATLLPFFMLGAVYFFWQILYRPAPRRRDIILFAAAVALTLHIYLASRVLWLLFPAFLAYLFLIERPTFWRAWRRVLAGLMLAGLLVLPMFVYLQFVPTAETRLEMLDSTLNQATRGNLLPILQNSRDALLAFVWPGYGDQFLAYNIPGRPVFSLLAAPFFMLGLAVSAWRWRTPRYAFLLGWFLLGIAPSLVTGATANTTRNIGALPAIYLLAGLGFWQIGQWVGGRWGLGKPAGVGLATLWLGLLGVLNSHAYFNQWAANPEVRAAYQTTIIAALNFADEAFPPEQTVLLSSVYPGSAHDTSISMVVVDNKTRPWRWSDARLGMLWP